MLKADVLTRIRETGLVGVIRADDQDRAVRISEACMRGGLSVLEITFTVPNAAETIRELSGRYSMDEVIIGAGTVLDAETARIAISAGARFVVSPSVSSGTAQLCNRYGVPYMPGAGSVTEIVHAMELGADIVKLFPADVLGPLFLKSVLGPLPHASLMPTGGVRLDNVDEWIQAGAVALGVGSELTRGLQDGNDLGVTDMAARFISAVRSARR